MTFAWFSSAGDTEVGGSGSVPPVDRFLRRGGLDVEGWFPPVRKPGPKRGLPRSPRADQRGISGPALLDRVCDVITRRRAEVHRLSGVIILDDADCRHCADPEGRRAFIRHTQSRVRVAAARDDLPVTVLLACPEVEMWLIADWAHTFQAVYGPEQAILSPAIRRPVMASGEAFGCPPRPSGGCTTKLRRFIAEEVGRLLPGRRYRPAYEGVTMLEQAHPDRVAQSCPAVFRPAWLELLQQRD